MKSVILTVVLVAATGIAAAPATAQIIGTDAAACAPGGGPAILANLTGLKDRKGSLKLELYPAAEDDFLKDDYELVAQGKVFRRVRAGTPASGSVSVCIRVPHPGRYALLATHDRDGKNKFNFFSDGAGFPSNKKLGMSRPKLAEAVIDVGSGVTTTTIRMQYLRGVLSGFGPTKDG
ncbi:DUF2141 domain-containing protein [Sphingomonas oligophenolica]|uniref:DUF2141 domain-containing protein n=1 Tax=Sphingomonas oligophenolica TaxID=301154 RepID=A0A502CS35_9SPHN|nr:DUF2141 domain-containing protein [Sphingomonas oligophenolica]TPG15484.1 DUF2141 domain-containing protein [Sphingomonas oligophenolica]